MFDIEADLDRSAHDLQLLANFYHAHGYTQRAQELYRTLLRIRHDRNKSDEAQAQAGDNSSQGSL
jgi:uncharacterized protein HemY